MEQISVVVADDIEQTRQDISRLLYFEDDISVVGEAGKYVVAHPRDGRNWYGRD